MKKLTVMIATLVLTLALTTVVSLAASINVVIDGNPVQFTGDVGQPFLDENSRVQVPLRAAMEAYGCKVDWNNETKTAIVEKDGVKVEATIGQSYILKNGQQVQNDTAATMKGGKTYLPIRVVLESFGAKVDWDGKNNSVVVEGSSDVSSLDAKGKSEFAKMWNIQYDEDMSKETSRKYYRGVYNGALTENELVKYLKSLDEEVILLRLTEIVSNVVEGANNKESDNITFKFYFNGNESSQNALLGFVYSTSKKEIMKPYFLLYLDM